MPTVVKESFEEQVRKSGILPLNILQNNDNCDWIKNIEKTNFNENKLAFDDAMIPDVIFYDNKQVISYYFKTFFFLFNYFINVLAFVNNGKYVKRF